MIYHNFPVSQFIPKLKKNSTQLYVFLETNQFDNENYTSYLFLNPIKFITCNHLDEVVHTFIQIDHAVAQGFYLAGYISYEAGYAFEEKLRTLHSPKHGSHCERFSAKQSRTLTSARFPLIWFGVFKNPIIFNHKTGKFGLVQNNPIQTSSKWQRSNTNKYIIKNILPNIRKTTYYHAIHAIKKFIEQGETYQVNYTYKLRFDFHGHPLDLYAELREKQPVAYNGYINTDSYAVISCSPELFFRKQGNRLLMRPMKGTFPRGKTIVEDKQNIALLSQDLKNRSENIMIVDLLRNDLGKISQTGSVHPVQLFTIEKYKTVLQMTSTIASRLPSNLPLSELFRSLFPSGSVTGAPKINTMEIIYNLEKEPRGIYTGCIGFITPKKDAVFNVAIRTVVIDKRTQQGELGVGSGIVYDSEPESEYQECRLKANFLTVPAVEFQLIETLLWTQQTRYYLLKFHRKRLKESAAYFDFHFSLTRFEQELAKFHRQFDRKSYRIRVLLAKDGKFNLSATPLIPLPRLLQVTFSQYKTDSTDVFLYHKTTQRMKYDREYAHYQKQGYYDVIFQNEKNEITEGAISNVFIKKNNKLYTPPVHCGLLNGVYRQYLLLNRKKKVYEKILTTHDILTADAVYLTNAVRKLIKVQVMLDSASPKL